MTHDILFWRYNLALHHCNLAHRREPVDDAGIRTAHVEHIGPTAREAAKVTHSAPFNSFPIIYIPVIITGSRSSSLRSLIYLPRHRVRAAIVTGGINLILTSNVNRRMRLRTTWEEGGRPRSAQLFLVAALKCSYLNWEALAINSPAYICCSTVRFRTLILDCERAWVMQNPCSLQRAGLIILCKNDQISKPTERAHIFKICTFIFSPHSVSAYRTCFYGIIHTHIHVHTITQTHARTEAHTHTLPHRS